MILSREELIGALKNEVRVLLHLASKVDAANADYRPSPAQRSTLELLRYLTLVGPIHMRGVLAGAFSMDDWRTAWTAGEATAKTLNLDQIRDSIGKQPAQFEELLGAWTDADLRAEYEMFGRKASRASWIVTLVLCHCSAYRMQLFLYLKASGHEELNTMNLWVGVDAPSRP